MDLGDPCVISPDEAVEDLRQKPSLLASQSAHDAEIDGDDAPLMVDEKIALVHVGMKESVTQRSAQKGLDQGARERARIKSEFSETLRIGQGNPVDPFHRHHFPRRTVPIDCWSADVWVIP